MSTKIMKPETEPEAKPKAPGTLASKICQIHSKTGTGPAFVDFTEKGKIRQTQHNVMAFLKWAGIIFAYDEFSLETRVFGVPGHHLLDDACMDAIFFGMDMCGLQCGKDYLWTTFRALARQRALHPVRGKLAALEQEWDGVNRLDTWLIDYFGAEDTPYTRAIGAKWMMAAVRRVRQPGCKFDHVLILEGPQGAGKSTALRILAYDEYFTDNMTVGLDPKEVIELSRGKWICELAELTNLNRRDVEQVKAFVTRQADEARKAYGRETSIVERQFVLAASTNRDRYQRDESGDRRFWVVEVKGTVDTDQDGLPRMVDFQKLLDDRDQLWAEAAVRERQGEELYLPPEIEAIARKEQAKRFDADERQQVLEDLFAGESGFVPNDVLFAAIGFFDKKDHHPGISKITAGAMRRLGWSPSKKTVGDPGRQVRGWQSPDGADQVLMLDSGGVRAVDRKRYVDPWLEAPDVAALERAAARRRR